MIPGGSKRPFPRDKIPGKIDRIKNINDLSQDELATIFSTCLSEVRLRKDKVIKRNIVTDIALDCI
jgi:hypothetical protein